MITKVEAIKKVLEEFNGVATWKQIYDNIEKYYPPAKVSKKWEAGLRGVLYREKKENKTFKKIGLGIFALKNFKEEPLPKSKEKIRFHSFIEGILLGLGDLRKFQTYTPDKTAIFKDNISLSQIETLKQIPNFTYSEIITEIKRIDVLWFNKKKLSFPQKAFEVVDSLGTLSEALNRCCQLLSFNVSFYIVAPEKYKNNFETKINKEPYLRFKKRFLFKDYNNIINFHKQTIEYNKLREKIAL